MARSDEKRRPWRVPTKTREEVDEIGQRLRAGCGRNEDWDAARVARGTPTIVLSMDEYRARLEHTVVGPPTDDDAPWRFSRPHEQDDERPVD